MQQEEVQLQEEVRRLPLPPQPPFAFNLKAPFAFNLKAPFAFNLNLFLQLREAEAEYELAEFELQQIKAQQVIIALRDILYI